MGSSSSNASQRVAPGKVTRTSKLERGGERPVQRKASPSGGDRATGVKSAWEHTTDPWMDAAHRGAQAWQTGSGAATSGAMTGGLKPGVSPGDGDEMLGGGRTIGEAGGDAGRVVGTTVGNAVGSTAAALTGISIASTTTTGPSWRDHGNFEWVVGFGTTGRSGWIVQEVVNTYRAQDDAGNDLGGPSPTPQYWEAWAVDASGNITPNVGANHDYWLRPDRGNDTQGHWSMRGKVYFTTTDPATQGFTAGGAPDAGILLSSTSAPSGLGVARLHRYAQGTWDSTGATPTHEGSAR
jgi:hypothetical protein